MYGTRIRAQKTVELLAHYTKATSFTIEDTKAPEHTTVKTISSHYQY